jgi:hypothetical protein
MLGTVSALEFVGLLEPQMKRHESNNMTEAEGEVAEKPVFGARDCT